MHSPRIVQMLSLFRNRGPRGFDFPARYYDLAVERAKEREARAAKEMNAMRTPQDRAYFQERIRHSWHREKRDGSFVNRLLVVLGAVLAMLYLIYRTFFEQV